MIHSSGFGFFLNRMHFNSSVRFLRSGEPLSRGQIIWRALSIHRGRGFRTSHPHSSRSSRSFILVHQLHPFIGVHSSSFISFIRSSVFIHPHSSRSSGSSVHHVHSSPFIRFIRSSVFIHPHSSASSVHRCSFIRIHQVHPFIDVHSSFVHQVHPHSSDSSQFIRFIRSSDSSPFIRFIRSSVFIHPVHPVHSSSFISFIRSSVFIHPHSSASSVHRCSFILVHHVHQIHPLSSRSSRSFILVHQVHPFIGVHSSAFIRLIRFIRIHQAHPFITLISIHPIHHAHLNSSSFILIHPHSSSFITFVHPRSSAFIGVHNLRIISDIAQKFLCSFPRVYLDLQCPKAKNRALTT